MTEQRVQNLPRLTSLRALAALGVFAFHLARWHVVDVPPLLVGYVGVAFFFVLSGFVLSWSAPAAASARGFWWRRFARVYPLHLVAALLALAAPVTAYGVSGGAIGANLLLAQAWWPVNRVAFGVNGVSWSLSCEAAFYLAFPVALRLLRSMGAAARWRVAAGWFGVASLLVIGLQAAGGGYAVVAFTNPAIRFGEFLLGVVAGLAVKSGWRPPKELIPAAGILTVATVVLHVPWPVADVTLTPLFFLVVVAAARRDLSVPSGLLTHRWLVYAGEVSFAFYLVHELVLLNLPRVVALPGVVMAAVALLVSALLAVGLHHCVERPARRLLLGLSGRRSRGVVAPWWSGAAARIDA